MRSWLFRRLRQAFAQGVRRPRLTTRLDLEVLETRLTPTLSNHGGAILANVQVQALYLGPDWNSSLAGMRGQFEGFLQTTVSNSYLPMLRAGGFTGPGGATIGTGADTPGVIDPTSPPSDLLDSQIRSYLQADVGNLLQPASSNTLYFVFVQDGVVVDLGNGQTSVNAFSGYHTSFTTTSGQLIRYAVIPDAGSAGNSQAPWLSAFDTMTVVASHELAEAATDPDGRTWFDRSGNEVGDVVNGSTVYLSGYAVQREGSIPAAITNLLPMTPAGAVAGHQAAFSLHADGSLWEYNGSATSPTRIMPPSGNAVASISDQGIDDFGQPMIDLVDVKGNAYEYHDFLPGNPTAVNNPSFFPFTSLGGGVKQAVAGQAVSYVLFTNGNLKEYVDPNYSTSYYGYGVKPYHSFGGVLATGVAAINGGTDREGVNAVDYTVTSGGKTSLYEWRDVTASSTLLASGVTSFSAGQRGMHAYVSGGKAYLRDETVAAATLLTNLDGASAATVALGTSAAGGYLLEVVSSGGKVYEYNNATTPPAALALPSTTAVTAASKPLSNQLRILFADGSSAEFDDGGAALFWTDTPGSSKGTAVA